MKKVFTLLLLFFFLKGWSQERTVYVFGKVTRPLVFTAASVQLSPASFSLSLHHQQKYIDYYTLSLYNPTTQLNDQYVKVSNGYFLSNTKSFPSYNFKGMKKDSFNPYGVSDFGSAIASGLLNLLFESH